MTGKKPTFSEETEEGEGTLDDAIINRLITGNENKIAMESC